MRAAISACLDKSIDLVDREIKVSGDSRRGSELIKILYQQD